MEPVIVNGLKIYPFCSIEELTDFVETQKGILIAINAEKILHSTETTRNIINSNIGYCDGIGAIKAVQKKGVKNAIKIPGCVLWLEIVKKYHRNRSFYFVGGTQETIEETVVKIKTEFNDINITGFRNGYIRTTDEREELITDITVKKPDVVFVAMGSPKQELLMSEMFKVHPAIYQGLGGSFDVYTGKVDRAPAWFLEHNLEALYRVLKQPARINRIIRVMPFWFNLWRNKY